MLPLQGDREAAGGTLALDTSVERVTRKGTDFDVHIGGRDPGNGPRRPETRAATDDYLGASAASRSRER